MTDVLLLDKTEIWVYGVGLYHANLSKLASTVATVLGLPEEKVFVTDVRESHIVLDILEPSVKLENIAGKQQLLLDAIAVVEGVILSPNARIHSEGVLGVIGAEAEYVPQILSEADQMDAKIKAYTAKRVAVVSTGFELLGGNVEDTNLIAVKELMGNAGYEVESGGVVEDDLQAIAGRIARLVEEGFGIVITTGGVGAEDKDFTVEAFERLDRTVHTAVLARYTVGHGRHVKSSVRIAIAKTRGGIAVALPGPTHEVKLALPVLLQGLQQETPLPELVEAIAIPLRKILPLQAHQDHSRHNTL